MEMDSSAKFPYQFSSLVIVELLLIITILITQGLTLVGIGERYAL